MTKDIEQGKDGIRKEYVDKFLEILESIGYHAIDINEILYRIGVTGSNHTIEFYIKELPGWKFGLWLNILDDGYISIEFFTQFESYIDKFISNRSFYKLDRYFPVNMMDNYNIFKLEVIKSIKIMSDFIKDHPYGSWDNSHLCEDLEHSIPWSDFRYCYECMKDTKI